MGQRGPKPKQINWEEFDKLVSFQCTQTEVASFFGISVDTLDRLCQANRGEKLAEVWDKRKALGRVRLRKAQFNIVERAGPGAATMAIYLDKKMFPDENPDRPPPPDGGLVSQASTKTSPVAKSFKEFVLAAKYPPPFAKQEEMKVFGMTDGPPRLLLGARGYGKSDYVTVLGVAHEIYLDWFAWKYEGGPAPSDTTLIISKTKTRNTAMLQEIAQALKANGVVLSKENSSVLRVEGLIGKDHSVEALSIKSSFRGRHPKRIVMDDPVTEEDTSEAMRILVKKKYDEAYKLSKNILIIGQPAHAFDLYAELRPTLTKLEVPWGSISELDADLEAMKLAGVDENSIAMSYHLKIPEEGQSTFANIKYIDVMPAGSSVAFIDPSDGGDYTAMSVFKQYFNGMAVRGAAWKRPWYHCLEQIVALCKANNVGRICFETNATGRQPIDQLTQVLGPLGIGVVGVHSDTNKHAMIEAAGSYAHMIHLSRESDKVYTDQVVKYEHSAKHDDAPDSLARGLAWIGLIRGKK